MWARVIEMMLGFWLAVSPFVFRHPADERSLWTNDLGCALAIVALALLSYWQRMRHAHLGIAAVAIWLIGFGYFGSPHPLPPALQNDLLMGLLLLMFAIIPNRASLPPRAWLDFYAGEQRGYEPAWRANEAREEKRS
jgi:SPW repeat